GGDRQRRRRTGTDAVALVQRVGGGAQHVGERVGGRAVGDDGPRQVDGGDVRGVVAAHLTELAGAGAAGDAQHQAHVGAGGEGGGARERDGVCAGGLRAAGVLLGAAERGLEIQRSGNDRVAIEHAG